MKTKEDIRKALSVSGATIANWIRTGLIPEYDSEKNAYSISDYEQIVREINQSGKLTTRANRFQSQQEIKGLNAVLKNENKKLLRQLLTVFRELNSDVSLSMLALCLSALEQKNLIGLSFRENRGMSLEISSKNPTFSAFLSKWAKKHPIEDLAVIIKRIGPFKMPENEPDFLGAVYESMRNLGEKSSLGAFFTPSFLVNDLKFPSDAKVLDPCSGTGTILLSIIDPQKPPKEIYLRDTDALALCIAKVNFALFFNNLQIPVHTACINALNWNCQIKFDVIITNPPWGANTDEHTKAELIKQNSEWKNADSFGVILCQALKKLNKRGKLIFILPESFLYVDTHLYVRKKVFETASEINLRFFGNAFKDVQSKVIRLELDKSKKSCINLFRNKQHIQLSADLIKKNNFRTPAVNSPAEMQLLELILNKHKGRLSGCTFGLGIVTGNNKKHLFSENRAGTEAIFTGKELLPFGFADCNKYIIFNPKQLQQCAPLQLYRSPKICYRFISDKLQMVADSKGVLVLNSINFFIPPAFFNMKALAAFFSSPLCCFLYQKLFNSVKVLRNHLENMPIPASYFEQQDALEQLYNDAEKGLDIKNELLERCCTIFEIDVRDFKKLSYQQLS